MTQTVHPPAGATALLAVTDTTDLGWLLILDMLLGCVLMLAVALIINNIMRQYPLYWWTPHKLKGQEVADVEFGGVPGVRRSSPTLSDASLNRSDDCQLVVQPGNVMVPMDLCLTELEKEVLTALSNRM